MLWGCRNGIGNRERRHPHFIGLPNAGYEDWFAMVLPGLRVSGNDVSAISEQRRRS
jgi:hypothetical protein